MFRLENITKIYSRRGKEVKAFAATSLEVAKGEYTAIVGPSGSGENDLSFHPRRHAVTRHGPRVAQWAFAL
jgi:ABC-type dipeptide/oligopeptide/nickel transport system ATPase subunit